MLLLAGSTNKFRLVSSSAATLDVYVAYSDNASGTITHGNQPTAISSATTTDILAAPSGSNIRNANTINVRNRDASLSCDVTITLDVSATVTELWKATLVPGATLAYTEGIGWFVYAPAALLDQTRYVTADSVHATAATFADVTGLTFPVIAGVNYAFQCMFAAITNATTTGAQFGIGGVAMTYMVAAGFSVLLGSPTASATITSGVVTAIDTAVMAQTTGAAVNQPHIYWGGFTPSASGTFAMRATSEVSVAAGLTIRKGSWARVTQTAN